MDNDAGQARGQAADPGDRAIKANTVPAANQLAQSRFVTFEQRRSGRKVLFAGNSITRHAPKPEIGWLFDWGMAASAEDRDYVHIVMRRVREQDPDADFCIAQMAAWERAYWLGETVLAPYREAAAFDPDLIILRLAENVPRDRLGEHPFAPAYANLLDFLNPSGRAQVIITTSFWPAGGVDEAIRLVANQRGYPLVELGGLGEQDDMKAVGLFEHKGVAAHPGDAGMAAIAAAIIAQLPEWASGVVREAKQLDLSQSVHALCTAYPEIIDIMAALGFTDIVKPGMLNTVGRFMTLPKGAALRRLDWSAVRAALMQSGFVLTNEP